MRNRHSTLVAAMLLWLAGGPSFAANATPSEARIVTWSPGMNAADLRSRPDSDFVRLPSGRLVQLADVRRMKQVSRQIRTAPMKPLPAPLLAKPAGLGALVASGADLRAALSRSDNETIQLPSGRRLTIGQLKFLQPLVEQQSGRSLSAASPGANARVIKVGARSDWKSILQMPESTVVEAPGGTRVTVADIKRALRDEGARP
jgi:hypothetical protein